MSTRYTLIAGTKDWSSWSLRPYLALRHIGVPFEEEIVPLRRETTSPEILQYSPAGRVPVLKIAEGGVSYSVWDSLAICETLAERHPEARLLPADPEARAECSSYAAEMHSGFPDVRDQLSMEFVRRLPLPDLREDTRKQVARILHAWEMALVRHAGGFLFGAFSLADCMYAPVVSRFVTYGVEVSPAVRGYLDRVMALPAMQDWGADSQREVDAGLA